MGVHRRQAMVWLRTAVRRWAWVAVTLVGAVVLAWGAYELGQMRAERDALATALDQQREQAMSSGQTPVAPPADEVRRDPEVVEGEPVSVPPTEEQLRPLVREYVWQWLAANPPADGADGEDGQTPTVDELAALIAAEYARNPPADGEDGRTPTAAEILPIVVEVVDAWLAANPPPSGEDGRDGVDGKDGADSTVPGPSGDDGEPPLSWTFTHCGTVGLNCVTYRCERAADFDPAAPRYQCEPIDS